MGEKEVIPLCAINVKRAKKVATGGQFLRQMADLILSKQTKILEWLLKMKLSHEIPAGEMI